MKVAVLGGLGMQGIAALADLSASPAVETIICADANLDAWESVQAFVDPHRTQPIRIDAGSDADLMALLCRDVDVAIDLLPLPYMAKVFGAAIEAGVPVVSTNYAQSVKHLDQRAQSAGVALMTECGLDPGIDLVIYRHLTDKFDQVQVINSYCGGIPAKDACDNPLNYKISWNWEGVLRSTRRDARVIKNGQPIDIPAARQHANPLIHQIEFPGLGRLEAIPNGDAIHFTDLLGVTSTITETGRYSLRWPGWSAFWHPLKQLGILSEEPVPGLAGDISPLRFLVKWLAPKLQYTDDQKDLAIMLNVFEGLKDGRRIRCVSRIRIERDLQTGILAMAKGVGFTASIVAQMIADGRIDACGVLTPTLHVPPEMFLEQLVQKGIVVEEEADVLDERPD